MSGHFRAYCPDCGKISLRLIEETEPDPVGEYKQVCTCDDCDNLVYIIRGLHHTDLEEETAFEEDGG